MCSECDMPTATELDRARGGRGDADYPREKLVSTKMRRRPPLILVAEDDFEMRTLLAAVLKSRGYRVSEFGDGARLRTYLDAAQRAGRLSEVDLVISDVRMPGASGFDVLARMASWGCTIPFIAITAFGDDNTHAAARALGVAAMFDKPFDIEDLEAAVTRLVPSAASSI